MSKATPAPPDETQIVQVMQWILSGHSEHDIREAIAAQFAGTEPGTLIAPAIVEIAKAAKSPKDLIRGWCIEATREIYRRALDAADLGTALRAVRQLHDFAKA